MSVRFDFSGKRVWVTGAGRGIGWQIARQFTSAGALVTGMDIAFSDDIPFTPEILDITDAAQVDEVCERLLSEQGGVDVLVNAAGILRLGALGELTHADWNDCLAVNASGVFNLLNRLAQTFKDQRSGCIVTVASNAAHVPRMNMAAYCASKAAVKSLTECTGLELAEFGVRCNLVSPGSTDTPMLSSMLADEAAYQRTINGLPEQYKNGIPLKKIATPKDIADSVLFLASDLAGHITMQDMVVDGGATLSA